MQRLVSLRTGTSRLFQVVNVNHLNNSKLLNEKLHRCLSSKNNDSNNAKNVDTHPDLYQASTAKQRTHIPDNLKGGQAPENIDKKPKNPSTGGGTVWSAQNPEGIHIAPLGQVKATTFVAKSNQDGKTHETTVYTTQGGVKSADSFKTHNLQPQTTPAQLSAEEAAASAFKPFAENTSSTSKAEAVFTPKVSSTKFYSPTSSPTSSPTAHFDTDAPASSSSRDTIKYETSRKGKVYGGQDTSAETKKRPNENPFNLKEQIKPSSDRRGDILRESLKYVHEKGWSMEAIRAGINACNQPKTTEELFYNGYDLVEYFMRDANAKMMDYMNELSNRENIQGTRLFIDGLKYRLKLLIPYADTWEQALSQKGFPANAKRAWKSLLDLANDAWISIGDTSMDIKWYTKRLSVAAIYRSAEIYMLQDQSPDKTETMNFLERHLGDFQTTGSVRPSVSQSLSDTAQVASGLLTVVRTMATRR